MKLQKLNTVNSINNSASQLAKCTCYCYCFFSATLGYLDQGVKTGLVTMAAKKLSEFLFKRK